MIYECEILKQAEQLSIDCLLNFYQMLEPFQNNFIYILKSFWIFYQITVLLSILETHTEMDG